MARARGRPFPAGNKASKGRPAGSRNQATLACQELFGEYAGPLTRKCIAMALQGDATALRLSLERICPPCKDSPIQFALHEIKTPADVAAAGNSVLQAISRGELNTTEGKRLMNMLDQLDVMLVSSHLEERLKQLERTVEADET
jgi:hypothetical protein